MKKSLPCCYFFFLDQWKFLSQSDLPWSTDQSLGTADLASVGLIKRDLKKYPSQDDIFI